MTNLADEDIRATLPTQGEAHYRRLKEALEKDHYGCYVMIDVETAEYVVGPTTSEVHAMFIQTFGDDAPGWCTRIGASVFATA